MLKFIFGIIWLTIMSTFAIIYYIAGGASIDSFFSNGGESIEAFYSNLLVGICFSVFILIGLMIFISGLKIVIKDNKTKRYGIQCYGIIRFLQHSGIYINEAPEYKAKIEILNPETNQREVLDEIIGLNYFKYPVNSYVLCKYFQGDVNIISIVPESGVPSSIKKSLPVINTDIKYSDDKEYVNIDGINYKKVR